MSLTCTPSPKEVSGLTLSLDHCSLVPVPAPVEDTALGLLLQKSLTQACFCGGCCLGPVSAEVTDSDLHQWRLLAQACSCGGTALGLLRWRSLARACSCDLCLGPAQAEDTGLGLINGGLCLRPAPVEVAGSDLLQWRMLPWVRSGRVHWLKPAPVEVTASGLLWQWSTCSGLFSQMSLAWVCSCRGP